MTDDTDAGAGRAENNRHMSPSPTTAPQAPEQPRLAVKPIPLEDMPLHIGDLLPGLRAAMESARMAYHHGGADGQDILQAQAEALDALFVRVLDRATYAEGISSGKPIKDYLSADYINLALRTQRHCRKTIESLTVLQERERQRLAEKRANRLKEIENDKNYKRLAAEQEERTIRALQKTKAVAKIERPENGGG